ncbi:cache domain-containing sensor histidine kinase [Neobacillus sp. Marseille-QA0830]
MKGSLIKLKNLLQQDHVRVKYFLLILGISILPLLLLGFISFNIAKNTLVENQLQTTKNHLKTSSEVADLLFRNIINMERLISWNQDVRRELIDSAKNAGAGENIINQDTSVRIQTLISRYLIDTQYIDSVCLFDVNFRSVCYGNSSSIGVYDNGGIYQDISASAWYEKAVESQGSPVFFGHNVLNKEQSKNTFSSVKLLKDPQKLFAPEIIGLLVVNMNKSMFARVFHEDGKREWIVLDPTSEETNVIFHYPTSSNVKFVHSIDSNTPSINLQKKGYLFSSYQNETTGWTFFQLIKEKELFQQSNQIRIATLLISLFLGVIALFLSFFLSGTVARPINNLMKISQKVTDENKELSEKLVRAQLKEKEAELRTLQAQIKPHFLYNTLDSIYWMATLQNNPDIAQIAVALSESFKLSLNKGEDMIPVKKELEHIRHYMTIQNHRYRNRFHYEESVTPELMEKKILKLLLQPLVENAIYHGLEPKIGKGLIKLTGKIEDGWITFTVSDTGVGIEDLKVTEQGFGLRNVQERILLCNGPESTFTVRSRVNEGTSIEIHFRPHAREE